MATLSDLPDLSSSTATSAATGTTATATATSAATTASTATSQTESQSDSTASSGQTTGTSSASATSVISNAPSLTSGITISQLTGLPTLSGAYSYPAPTVPPTANAPYMQNSSLPQNFVFIIVGSVIAFLTLSLIAWRFLTAWSINKSFKRDAATGYAPLADMKKKPMKTESSHDMADLSALPKSFSNVPSLFFSPTAEVARQSMVRPQSHHQHMPAGHYRDGSK